MSISPMATAMMPTMGMMPQSPQPLFTNYSQTGIPSLGGGMAYMPGSDMTKFMDNLNNTVSTALSGPTGGSLMDWANGLLLQQQQRKQMQMLLQQQMMGGMTGGMPAAGGAGGGMANMTQMFQQLMSMMSSLKGAA